MLNAECVAVGLGGRTALRPPRCPPQLSGGGRGALGAGALVDATDTVRAGCSCLGAECVNVGQGGATSLHYIACQNSLEVAELLWGAGASVKANNNVKAECNCLGAECVAAG